MTTNADSESEFIAWLIRGKVDGSANRAVAVWSGADGFVTAYAFGMTAAGLVDLVGFTIRPALDPESTMRVIGQWADYPPTAPKPTGLTSRHLRSAASQQGLLREARRRLGGTDGWAGGFFGENWSETVRVRQEGRMPTLTDEFLAEVVLQYDALLNDGEPAARERFAGLRGMSVGGVKRWLDEAKRRGLWLTAGPGRPGQPSQQARNIAIGPKGPFGRAD